jgi:hypothetical protein
VLNQSTPRKLEQNGQSFIPLLNVQKVAAEVMAMEAPAKKELGEKICCARSRQQDSEYT